MDNTKTEVMQAPHKTSIKKRPQKTSQSSSNTSNTSSSPPPPPHHNPALNNNPWASVDGGYGAASGQYPPLPSRAGFSIRISMPRRATTGSRVVGVRLPTVGVYLPASAKRSWPAENWDTNIHKAVMICMKTRKLIFKKLREWERERERERENWGGETQKYKNAQERKPFTSVKTKEHTIINICIISQDQNKKSKDISQMKLHPIILSIHISYTSYYQGTLHSAIKNSFLSYLNSFLYLNGYLSALFRACLWCFSYLQAL